METPGTSSFAQKLEYLFQHKTRPDGTPYTPADILRATNGVLTRIHLWKLRTGKAANPSFRVIQSLADAFDVPPGYFFENNEAKPTADNQKQGKVA
ncbi:MAG: helix-turn-helix domain-containing protein [Anaerolineales bacterium]